MPRGMLGLVVRLAKKLTLVNLYHQNIPRLVVALSDVERLLCWILVVNLEIICGAAFNAAPTKILEHASL